MILKERLSVEPSALIARMLFFSFMFFIPISPTLKSIFFISTLVFLIITPSFNRYVIDNYKTFWGGAGLVLFLFIVLSSAWSPATLHAQMSLVGKYCKLLYLPILAVGFMHLKTRVWTLNAYLAAMVLTCVISILQSKGWLMGTRDPGEVFYNHIITGFMVAFGAYVALLRALVSSGKMRWVYWVVALLASYQVLFINTGRTGYIVFFILMVLLLLNTLSFQKACIGILFFCGVFLLAYHQSPIMQLGLKSVISDVQFLKQNNKNTSIGYRIQFHEYAKSLFWEHPILGIGVGGFKERFTQDNPIPAWGSQLNDPHSQYWMTLSEQGAIGFILLLIFLFSLYLSSLPLQENKPLLLGILVAFCIGSVTDTILCYSTAGYLLIVMSALCFGEVLEEMIKKKSTMF